MSKISFGSFNRENTVKCPCRECNMRTKYGDCHSFCPAYRNYRPKVKKVHEKEKHFRRRTW